ncbi:MAG: zinc-ribbon domain-containing protein, partial [Burkholderiaceae bacterium]|nr:zinc-ribbon domain-containing protein [Burkholderiaceae bacterium]
MALATKCPHCNTVFRVAHDQLKLRGGIVRCGSCNEVFDGNAALLAPPAAAPLPAAPPATPPAPAPAHAPEPAPEYAPAADLSADLSADFSDELPADLTPAPATELPSQAESAPAPTPAPTPLPEASAFDAKMDALDSRAAAALQDETDDTIQTLELDTAIDMEALDEAVATTAPDTASLSE